MNINMFYSILSSAINGLVRLIYKNLRTKITYSTIGVDKKLKIYCDMHYLLMFYLYVLIFLKKTWNTYALQEIVLRFCEYIERIVFKNFVN